MTKRDDRKLPAGGVIELHVDGSGFAVEGPGFYVWDENLEAVLAAARELSQGRFPATPRVQRALLVPHIPGIAGRPARSRGRRLRSKRAGPETPSAA